MSVSTFAPVYRLPRSQQSHLTRQHKQGRKKRKEPATKDADEDVASSAHSETSFRPLDRDDPYLVAGYTREKELPEFPFPHAPVSLKQTEKLDIEQELYSLKPPVHSRANDTSSGSTTKRTHLNNLTALLHKCVYNEDWDRASRILGLLLRSEFGLPMDLRHHGRWALAAEILMRRGGQPATSSNVQQEGLNTARKYYERLILQYPYTARAQNSFSAVTIYPSLFNIWIFEVQQRSKLARQAVEARQESSSSYNDEDIISLEAMQIRRREIQEAEPIAARLDDLLAIPPCDTNTALLRLRAAIATWLADLCTLVTRRRFDDDSIVGSQEQNVRLRSAGEKERTRAREVLQRLANLKT